MTLVLGIDPGTEVHQIDLPAPISTNKLYKNKRSGRGRTEEYNTWKWHAHAMLQNQKPLPKFPGKVRITFAVGEIGISPNMDGDNCQKCLQDALVTAQVIVDDSRKYVRSVGMEWVPGKRGVTAYIYEVTA